MTREEIEAQGQNWLALGKQIEDLEEERETCEGEITWAATQIAMAMRTPHGQSLFSNSGDHVCLDKIDGETFSFAIIDSYDDARGSEFKLTLDQLANPDQEAERLTAEFRAREIQRAEAESARAQRKLDKLRANG